MDSKLLIDSIMQQTTVLIAELATAAGIRAPLSHIADQVFVDLAREIEAHGVSRKVAADMFGLSLRSYQKKVQRLTGSQTEQGRSLWEALVEFVRAEGSVTRRRILEQFKSDDRLVVGAVLNDLVTSGLLYSTGRGEDAVFGMTSEADRKCLFDQRRTDVVCATVWMSLYREPATLHELRTRLPFDGEILSQALELLSLDGRIEKDGEGRCSASRFMIPLGATQGWEAAVYDHFRAVATAIAMKVKTSRTSRATDEVGGTTLSFDLDASHPHRAEVHSLLRKVREEVMDVWGRVTSYNEEHPPNGATFEKVYFYFGQYVEEDESSES